MIRQTLILFLVITFFFNLFGCAKKGDSSGGEDGLLNSLTGQSISSVAASLIVGNFLIGESTGASTQNTNDKCQTYKENFTDCHGGEGGSTNALLTYSGCQKTYSSERWFGGEILVFNNGTRCGDSFPITAPNATLTRTFAQDTRVETDKGIVFHVDSTNWSGYNTAVRGGIVYRNLSSSEENMFRSMTVSGLHIKATASNQVAWDQTISSDASNPIFIQGAGNSRQVTVGSFQVQHNLNKFTTTHQVTSPLTYKKSEERKELCCYPTSGTLRTSYSGGPLEGKTEEIAFGPNCGQVLVKLHNGAVLEQRLELCL